MQEDFDVGGRLRALRSARGMTQRDLASRASVTPSLIATIESNKSSPSVASLRKVLSGLSITMAEFFEPERPADDGIVFRQGDLLELAGHGHATETADLSLRQVGDAARHNLQMLYEIYRPGGDTGESMLQHESSEAGVVIDGAIELTVDDQVYLLTAGDAYLFDSRRPHRFRNPGSVRCVIVSACTPPYL